MLFIFSCVVFYKIIGAMNESHRENSLVTENLSYRSFFPKKIRVVSEVPDLRKETENLRKIFISQNSFPNSMK